MKKKIRIERKTEGCQLKGFYFQTPQFPDNRDTVTLSKITLFNQETTQKKHKTF